MEWVLSLCLLYANTPKSTSAKAVPFWGRGTALAVEGGNSLSNQDCPTTNAPTPATAKQEPKKAVPLGGRWRRQATEGGNSLSILDCLTANAPTPATAKQEPEKAVPFWGRGTALAVEGGNSLSNQDCPPTSRPTPATAVQKNSTKSERPYNTASELPLSDTLTGAPLPKGRGSYNSNTFYIKQHS